MGEERPTSDTEKGNDKGKDKDKQTFGDDPPIIVGGGGSTFVWILKSKNPRLVADPTQITHPPPANPNNYHVFQCDGDITKVDSDNGKGMGAGSHAGHMNMDPAKHRTIFDA